MSRRWIETSRASSNRPVRLGVGCEIDQNARNFAASYLQSTVRGSSMRACLVGLPLLCCSSLCGAPPQTDSLKSLNPCVSLRCKPPWSLASIKPPWGIFRRPAARTRKVRGGRWVTCSSNTPAPPPPPPPPPTAVICLSPPWSLLTRRDGVLSVGDSSFRLGRVFNVSYSPPTFSLLPHRAANGPGPRGMQVPKFRDMVASLCQVIRLRLFLIITIENVTGGLVFHGCLRLTVMDGVVVQAHTENELGQFVRLANSALFVYCLPTRIFPSGRREEGGMD